MFLIGLSGRARHGKTITVDAMHSEASNNYGLKSKIYDIGKMIIQEAIEMGRLPEGTQRETMGREQLQVLIDVGKERRTISHNYWVEKVIQQVRASDVDVALCPNIRLPYEAQAVREAGGIMVRCTRLNMDGSLFISEDRPPNDITETALEFWPADYYLTTKPDQVPLLDAYGRVLFRYLWASRKQEV